MNRLDAYIRDVPRGCPCKWNWRKGQQRWVWVGPGRECPVHVPAVPR